MGELLSSMAGGLQNVVDMLATVDWFLIYGYLFFMVLDLITGWHKATKNGNFESSKMKEGLKGKIIELVLLFALIFIGKIFGNFGIIALASNVIIIGFVIKEFMSIMENANDAGLVIPKFIQNWLQSSKEEFENKNKK